MTFGPARSAISRRSVLAAGGGAGAAALLAACGESTTRGADGSTTASGSDGSGEDLLETIKSSGTLRVGVEGTYKPYGYHDEDGELTGFEVDIAEKLVEGLGATAEFTETKWDSLIAGLDVNKYDVVINNVAITDERKEKYDFTTPYARSIGRVAVPDGSDITTLDDLDGKNAAETATSNWAAAMTDLGATIVPAPGFAEAIELLLQGRADATANDFVSFETYQEENPDAAFTLLDEELPIDIQVGAILPKGQDALLDALNEQIETYLSDGTFKDIYLKYVSTDLSPQG